MAPEIQKVTSVTINCGADKVYVGDTVKLTVSVSPENAADKRVKFSVSSGGEHASVSSDGTLNAISAGTVKIKAVSEDGGAEATISVKIYPVPVKSIEITAGSAEITIGETLALTVKVLPENAADKRVKFSISSGSDHVTVDQNGNVTAVAAGKAVIKAAAQDGSGVSAKFTVTVKGIPAQSVSLTSTADTLTVGGTAQLTATVLPENATDKRVTFYIADGSKYGKVSSDGKFTALAEGKVTVGAKLTSDGSIKAKYVITVKAASLWAGSGTKADPYIVATAEDLANISKVIKKSGYYFKQTADIDLAGYEIWTPLGNDDTPFSHNYDGNGKKITNLTLSGGSAGLFGCAENAILSNITVTGLSSAGDRGSNVGGIVGFAVKTRISGCSVSGTLNGSYNTGLLAGLVLGCAGDADGITDCRVSGTINGGAHTGGLAGSICHGDPEEDEEYADLSVTVSGCAAEVELLGCNGEDVGGLIGYADNVVVEHCFASGRITSQNGKIRGGLIGEIYDVSEVRYCGADVDITTTGTAYGDAFCGGLIGFMMSRCAVHDCFAYGDISCAGTWSDCQDHVTYDGGIWFRYRNPCGALIGCIYAVSGEEKITLYNCFAAGSIDQANPCTEDNIFCAGSLVGLVYDTATVKYIIKSEYRVSSRTVVESKRIDITEAELNGSMIGRVENNYCVSDRRETFTPMNYIVRSGASALVGQFKSLPEYKIVTDVTAEEAADKATFEGFDFENTWKMGANGPELR